MREFYSDLNETILDAQRPVTLNGIEEVVTSNDLLDRSIVVYLPRTQRSRRRPEKALWRELKGEQPTRARFLSSSASGWTGRNRAQFAQIAHAWLG